MPKYIAAGTIQGTGCDADKFYDVAWEYTAPDIDDARRQAGEAGMFVERCVEVTSKPERSLLSIPLIMLLVAQELQDSQVACKAVRVSQDVTEVVTIRVQWGGNDSSVFKVSKHDQEQASSAFVLTEYICRSVRKMIEERKRAGGK